MQLVSFYWMEMHIKLKSEITGQLFIELISEPELTDLGESQRIKWKTFCPFDSNVLNSDFSLLVVTLYLQNQLSHLVLLLLLLAVCDGLMVEQAEHAVLLQGSLVVLVIDVKNTVLPIVLWELQTFCSRRHIHETQAWEQEQPEGEHGPKHLQRMTWFLWVVEGMRRKSCRKKQKASCQWKLLGIPQGLSSEPFPLALWWRHHAFSVDTQGESRELSGLCDSAGGYHT